MKLAKKTINLINDTVSEPLIIGWTKGGIGKSILTFNTVIALQNLGINVRVADIDFQQTVYLTNIVRQSKQLEALNVTSIKSEQQLKEFVNEDFKGLTFIDIGGFDTSLNRLALNLAKHIILPFKGGAMMDDIGMLSFKKILNEEGIGRDKFKILLNQIHPNKTNLEDVKESIKKDFPNFMETVIHTSGSFDKESKGAKGVTELKKRTVRGAEVEPKPKLEILALAKEILTIQGA